MTILKPVALRPDKRRGLEDVVSHPDVVALATVLVAVAFFSITARGFLSIDNFRSILLSVAVVACMALGENLVILAGEIDVSVGSILALAGFVAGPVALATGSTWPTLAVGLGVCVPDSADILGAGRFLGVPVPVLVVLVAFAILAVVRRNTNWGRDLMATG